MTATRGVGEVGAGDIESQRCVGHSLTQVEPANQRMAGFTQQFRRRIAYLAGVFRLIRPASSAFRSSASTSTYSGSGNSGPLRTTSAEMIASGGS